MGSLARREKGAAPGSWGSGGAYFCMGSAKGSGNLYSIHFHTHLAQNHRHLLYMGACPSLGQRDVLGATVMPASSLG